MKSRYDIVLIHAKHQIDVQENSFIPIGLFSLLLFERGYKDINKLVDLFDREPQCFGIFMVELTGDLDEIF